MIRIIPQRPRDPRGGESGSMLIEVVATMAITMMLIAFVFPMVSLGTTPSRLLALVSASASLLRDARTTAIARHTPVAARFLAPRRQLEAGRDVVTIPADVGFSLTAGGNCPAGDHGTEILFRPDGTNCGGLLRFSKSGRILRARVNWVDGHVEILEGG